MQKKDYFEPVVCNLCGKDDYIVVYKDKYEKIETEQGLVNKFKSSGDETLIDQVVKCKHCGLMYINPRIKPELIIQGYSEGTDETFISQVEGREKTFARGLKFIEKYALKNEKKPGKILDIGTAGGSFLHVAKQAGWEVHGLELNKWLCNWAKEHYDLDIQSGTLFEQHYPDNTFDVITLWDVLEHVPDPSAILQECNRILKEGGVIALNVPDSASWMAKILQSKWVFLLSVHLYYFTPSTMKKILEKNNFSLLAKKPHFQILQLGYLTMRMKAYSPFLHKVGATFVKLLHMKNLQIPYWLGQTLFVAQKKKQQ